jgi:quinohemoprotein ethanol dehydrogenase
MNLSAKLNLSAINQSAKLSLIFSAGAMLWGQPAATPVKPPVRTGRDWVTYGFTPGETRYVPLKQIDASNVGRLGLDHAYDLGAGGGGQEATPMVRNGVLYTITNWSVVYAFDLRTQEQLWRWDPEVNRQAVGPRICCGVVNRGLAMFEDLIIAPAIDGRLQGLDAKTGKVRWEARVAYPQDNFTVTIAPRMAGNKVIVGVSGGDRPTRGFVDAFDARTGAHAWRFYTVPGEPSHGFENEAMRRAAATWEGDWWRFGGGGAVWDAIAYDPQLDFVYFGTGNAEPWPEEIRKTSGKDNLYTCSILAVRGSTGQYVWHYQVVPNDNWDFDSVQQLMLADLTIQGRPRKVIMQASKNGFYYVLDRVTGQFISAEPYSKVNWASRIDSKTGRPVVNPGAVYGRDPVTIFPTAGGGHNWAPMAFHPSTGLVYIPATTGGSWTFAAVDVFKPEPGSTNGIVRPMPKPRESGLPYVGPPPLEGGTGVGGSGALVAWDPVAQKTRWRMPGGGGIGGGALATGGNLVFQTINNGHLVAYSADQGEKLLDIDTHLRSGMGPPITYELDGKQYVALMGGIGGVTGNAGPGNAGPGATPKLLVFALDGKAPLPEVPLPEAAPAPPPVGDR